MARRKRALLLFLIAVLGWGCSVPILRQDVPVSTNPLGATIYADGQVMGQTPGTVSLERNRDHLLTLVKDDYRQEDIPVRRQYQSDRVLMKAVQAGVNSGLFFHDAGMGVSSGFNAVAAQEESGEAYVLVPSVVQVELTPLAGLPAGMVEPSAGSPRAEANSSTKSYVKPDGTMVTEKSQTTVGVSVNPAAVPAILDVLFK